MSATAKAFALGALAASTFHCRRGIAREWQFALRDLADLRAELKRYLRGR